MDRLALSKKLFEEAEKALGEYKATYVHIEDEKKLTIACEKGWEAAQQALMHAAKKEISDGKELSCAARELARKYGNENINIGGLFGSSLHAAYRIPGMFEGITVEGMLELVKKMIKEIEEITGGDGE